MKKIAYLPIVLFPIAAGADVTVYFDKNNVCPDLCLQKPSNGQCCPTGSLVTGLRVGARADASFTEIKVGNTTLFDTSGAIKSEGIEALRVAATDGTLDNGNTKITGGYECITGTTPNKNGVCVNSLSENEETHENVAYIDWESLTPIFDNNGVMVDFSGGEIEASEIKDNGSKDCYYDRDFDIVIHWCPKNYDKTINITYQGAHIQYDANQAVWPDLACERPDETYHYTWDGGTSLGVYTQNDVPKTEIVFPTVEGWSPRGFYIINYPEYREPDSNQNFNNIPYFSVLRTVADNLVTEQTTTWGRARLGLPFNQFNVTNRIILNNKVNGYGDANANWQIWTCDGNIETVHMYAAWARNCNPGDGATCNLTIKRNGLSNPDKGDAIYNTNCTNGATLNNAGAYNASCDLGKCSENNLPGCTSLDDCTDITGAHWCFSGSTPSCMSSTSGRDMCCNDNLEACDKKTACADVGGTWDDENGTCATAGGDKGPGDLQPAFTIEEDLTGIN